MAHGRRVQQAAPGRTGVDVREVAEAHGEQVAVAEHRALGPAGGAAGVEEPRRILGRPRRERKLVAREQAAVLGAGDFDELRRVHPAPRRLQAPGEPLGEEAHARSAVRQDEGELVRVQLRIDRHRDEAGVPAGIKDFQVLRAVDEHQCDTVARTELEARNEDPGEP